MLLYLIVAIISFVLGMLVMGIGVLACDRLFREYEAHQR